MAIEESPQEGAAAAGAPGEASAPGDWSVPVPCFHCGREYPVAVKHFRTGAVLCCPHCHGSYVVLRPMYGEVSNVVRQFDSQSRGALGDRTPATGDACTTALRDVTRGFRPPGAPRRRASMFG